MGVNMQTGKFRYHPYGISVGPFVLQRGFNQADFPFLGRLYTITKQAAGGAQMPVTTVALGESKLEFTRSSQTGNFLAWSSAAQGWHLAYNGSVYTLSDKTGAVYTLAPVPGYDGFQGYTVPRAKPLSVQYADGHRIDITYNGLAEELLLKSNRGYALRYERDGTGTQVKVCGFNLTTVFVNESTPCAGALQTVTLNYQIMSADFKNLISVVDVEGRTSTLQYAAPGPVCEPQSTPTQCSMAYLQCMTFPNSSTCEFTNVFGPQPGEITQLTKPDQVRVQTQADGQQWTYNYDFPIPNDDDPPYFPGDPRPHYSYAWLNGPGGFAVQGNYERGLLRVLDMTGQYLALEYDGININKTTYAEGNSIAILRDHIGNAYRVTETPKPGSGQTSRVAEATFPYAPANANPYLCDAASWKLCDKPIWRRDPLGNQTDYTYDPAHGGVLTETGPAVGGVRPQVRYTYTQRNAMVKDAAGNFVAMQPPIWVLTQKSICKTGAASGNGCALGGDEVRTLYDYGPTTGASNLLLRGVVEDSSGIAARTCYLYDAVGNKIAESAPLGTGTSCP